MKIGCLAWTFRPLSVGAPWYEAIDTISRLGFEGVELIVCTEEELDSYWSDEEARKVRDFCQERELPISQLAIFQPAIGGLISLDKGEQDHSLEVFERCCELARMLGTPLVNYVSQWPIGIKAPIDYVPNYFYVPNRGPNPAGKLEMEFPPGFDWDEQWGNVVQMTKATVDIAKGYGLKLSLEGHINVAVPHTDSFLRLYDHISDPALGYCLDIGWAALQREHVPWSIYKLKGKLVNIHVRDCDHLTSGFAVPGEGVLHWPSIFQALRDIGYEGYMSLETHSFEGLEDVAVFSRQYLERHRAGSAATG
jgi:sugar phosphate isomerase/epimerase